MSFFSTFSHGFSIGFSSMNYVTSHPKMIFFTFIPNILKIFSVVSIINIIVYHTQWLDKEKISFAAHTYQYTPLSFIGICILLIVVRICSVFFKAALQHYIQTIFNKGYPSIKSSFQATTKHVGSLLIWSFTSLVVRGFLRKFKQKQNSMAMLTTQTISTAASFVWSFVTLFVIPSIMFDNKNVINAVSDSYELAKNNFTAQMGGFFAFSLLRWIFGWALIICMLPGIILGSYTIHLIHHNMVMDDTIRLYFITSAILIFIPIACIVPITQAAKNVFIVGLYNKARNRNAGPFETLFDLSH